MVAVPSDEISEKYLQKAISETNELGEEIARSAPEGAFPVIGSGHPLADLFMVKYGPQPAEAQEGVAYFGRAGQAILKSLQRLRIDPLAVYGTNCIKFAGQDEEEARSQLTRELHIVQPKLVVVMGARTAAFLADLRFPLSQPIDADAEGIVQRFTATIQALVTPDVDDSLDDAPAKTRFWNAFKSLGPWWAEQSPF